MKKIKKLNNSLLHKSSNRGLFFIALALFFIAPFKIYAGITEGYAVVLPAAEKTQEKHIFLFGEDHHAGDSDEWDSPERLQAMSFLDVFEETGDLRSDTLPVLLEKTARPYRSDSILGLYNLDQILRERNLNVSVENAEVRRMAIGAKVILERPKTFPPYYKELACFEGDKPIAEITIGDVLHEFEQQYGTYVTLKNKEHPNSFLDPYIDLLRDGIDMFYEEIILLHMNNFKFATIREMRDLTNSLWIIFSTKEKRRSAEEKRDASRFVQDYVPTLPDDLAEFRNYLTENRSNIIALNELNGTLLDDTVGAIKEIEQQLKNFSLTEEGIKSSKHWPTFLELLKTLYSYVDALYQDIHTSIKALKLTISEFASRQDEETNYALASEMITTAHSCLDFSLYHTILKREETHLCIIAGAGHIESLTTFLERCAGAKIVTKIISDKGSYHKPIRPYSNYPKQTEKIRLLSKEEISHVLREYSFLRRILEKARNAKDAAEKKLLQNSLISYCNQKIQSEKDHFKRVALLTISSLLCSIISNNEQAKNSKNKKELPYETHTNLTTTPPARRN